MSLLTDVQANALEPEYGASPARRHTSPLVLATTLAVLAALVAVALVSTTRTSAEADGERRDLLERINGLQLRVEAQEGEVAALETEIRELGDDQVNDPGVVAQQNALEPLVGTVPVTGPGVVVVVDDSADRGDGNQGIIFDSDLSRLINGLRQAGAEAVAINGRRVTALTPIRTAGSAITVDYVSLSPPYRVEAIGNPNTMPARFARTGAAAWWKYISDNYGIGFSLQEAGAELTLPADPGMILRFAKK